MSTAELFVSLKVPDNVAITAFHTLERMGFNQLVKLERSDYYKFEFSGDIKNFQKKISQVDILINANKHKYSFNLKNNNDITKLKKINVLTQNIGNSSGLLKVLRERLGFRNIKKLEKGVLWAMHFDKDVDANNIAIDITKKLLMNENYQKFKIFG